MDLFSIASAPATVPPEPRRVAAYARDQVLDEIISINPSATADFLAQFEDGLLRKYLEHLHYTQGPRGSGDAWERPNDAPSIMVRRRVV